MGSRRSSVRIPGLSGSGRPAVAWALDMCIYRYSLSGISVNGEKTNCYGQTFKAPSRPLGFILALLLSGCVALDLMLHVAA